LEQICGGPISHEVAELGPLLKIEMFLKPFRKKANVTRKGVVYSNEYVVFKKDSERSNRKHSLWGKWYYIRLCPKFNEREDANIYDDSCASVAV
jgi:hypothetical protein